MAGRSAATVVPEGMSEMKLVPGSMIDVQVFEEPDLDGSFRLDNFGNISMPLAGSIHLDSLTLRQAEAAISTQLVKTEVLKTAHVVANIDEYGAQNVTVTGEVVSPGSYPVLGPRKLSEILALAGGETPVAGSEIVIHRAGRPPEDTEHITYVRDASNSTSHSVSINPGDTVLIKRAGIVYVLGSVNRPGGYVMQEAGKLNIIQVLALAAGTSQDAANGAIRIIRKNPDGTLQELPVSYSKINKGKESPLPLQAEDVVFVPSSKLKSLFINGKSVMSAATSATIYSVY